jgi:transposase
LLEYGPLHKRGTKTINQREQGIYESERLDHLGIIAGVCQEIELAQYLDSQEPDAQRRVSVGTATVAMILNGLGFSNRRLYLVPQYFEHKPLEHLLGEGIKAEELNDDCLGRTLDWLYEHDVTRLFAGIARKARAKLRISSRLVHVDTTSFSVSGAYEAEPEAEVAISITYGYSRDHRADLKQWMLALATTQGADLPLFLRPLDGNSADQVSLLAAVEALQEQLRAPDEEESSIYVADSGIYSQANMKRLNAAKLRWVSRVPETSLVAREELAKALHTPTQWQASGDGELRWYACQVELPHGQERWVIVSSKAGEQRVHTTLQRQVEREQQSWEKRLWHLQAKRFACEADARAALEESLKPLPAWFEVQRNFLVHDHYDGKGRPGKQAVPTQRWQCQATLSLNQERLSEEERRRACFIIGTNVLEASQLADEELIRTYKQQGSVERGFRFLKDPLFLASSVFVKKPERIVALGFIMVLCLLVYRFAEYRLRSQLAQTDQTLPNQINKPTATPTMRWVFQCFEGIDLLRLSTAAGSILQVLHLRPFHEQVLMLLGPPYLKFYKLAP